MLIAGIVCLALAAAAGGYAWWQHRKHQELTTVEGTTCGELRQLADAVSVSEGAGMFRQRCELSGTAQPAYVGTVNAPQTGRECVWYRTKVTHEYWDYEWEERNGRRVRERHRRSDTIKDETSDIPFALDDGTGKAIIHPEQADVHAPHEVLDELEEDRSNPGLLGLLGQSFLGNDETIGYRREEWIVPVGTTLFVQGEVTDEDRELRLRKPEKGTFRISTRSEAELMKESEAGRKWGVVAAGGLAVVGLVLVVLGALG
jgi:E3 ubiquitin ligase